MTLAGKRILLVVGGGIAAYKALDLIRRLRERGASVVPVMTAGAREFVTPLAVGALSGGHVFTDLFDRQDEQDVGHIRLARDCDAVLVAPATANLMARAAAGAADDLAGAVLLATRAPVLMAPAMNPAMWSHPATRRNAATLAADGIAFVGPATGEMAEAGEAGAGRLAEPLGIVAALEAMLDARASRTAGARPTPDGPLTGRRILVTSGPTHEPIDPVRYIANRSSGRQGHAIAASLARLGASVHLVSGPVTIADPEGVRVTRVETARQMQAAVEADLPADAAVFVAAVADWRVAEEGLRKMKKGEGGPPPLALVENPDILAGVGHGSSRPTLVVGFAAETHDLIANARAKLLRKGADLIVANDVSPGTGVMGGEENTVHFVTREGVSTLPRLKKEAVADALARWIAEALGQRPGEPA
ncbi:bifunctional phosphopantothenoylcysteine decarboxylase/phosphopantothenate--cysteine ligase CoaBC [Aurantimonas sp. Leaf443]|uniref:bifunctional phosphopantothenoylcysteine decarboxylase/phosphopantothenate--cysteine ligase CoaBC n=1 Tax=Aurantimonas sp. Leaf443 TaxID=1736378 RepID=UPI0006F2559B|nr:bifunctional phosphopantothenoylcysteine decarboxylase/phosphopantothenate--cysteine ligase CoaBC [Aurantimonas sp. Leaf443]KQT83901.1 bifunctional phosphopantothenoylcysteine decarboxylase/phosphopantothenate synthase [Aurantimonas sp. Leaf443]